MAASCNDNLKAQMLLHYYIWFILSQVYYAFSILIIENHDPLTPLHVEGLKMFQSLSIWFYIKGRQLCSDPNAVATGTFSFISFQ